MKKIGLIFALLCSLMLPVFGQEAEFDSGLQLVDSWNEFGSQPEYVSGFWLSNDQRCVTIGIVGDHAQDIQALVRDPESIKVVHHTYTARQLAAIQEEIEAYLLQDLGFVGVGPDVRANCVALEVHMDYENDPDTLAVLAQLEAKYGAAFSYSWTNFYPQLTIQPDGGLLYWMPRQQQSFFWLMPLAVLAIFSLWSFYQRRRLLALIGGGTTSPKSACSIRQLRASIQADIPKFPTSIDTHLAESIKKHAPKADAP